MSRIRLNIDRLVLNGFEPREGKALANALEAQFSMCSGIRRRATSGRARIARRC